jgi:hypothetical protein
MMQASTARALLRRLHPWLGKAVHGKWHVRRGFYREESDRLLELLAAHRAAYLSTDLQLQVEKYLRLLYREWFPDSWRKRPAFVDILQDFRWWLGVAERWNEPAKKPQRVSRRKEPLSKQPEELLKRLGLPANCTAKRFVTTWRAFVKLNHPDLNPDQTPEEKRRFAEVVALRRR